VGDVARLASEIEQRRFGSRIANGLSGSRGDLSQGNLIRGSAITDRSARCLRQGCAAPTGKGGRIPEHVPNFLQNSTLVSEVGALVSPALLQGTDKTTYFAEQPEEGRIRRFFHLVGLEHPFFKLSDQQGLLFWVVHIHPQRLRDRRSLTR